MGFMVCPPFTTGTGTSVYSLRCRYISAPSTWTTKYALLPYTHLRKPIDSICKLFKIVLLFPGLLPLIASLQRRLCTSVYVLLSPSRMGLRIDMHTFLFAELIHCR